MTRSSCLSSRLAIALIGHSSNGNQRVQARLQQGQEHLSRRDLQGSQ
jgi:hypothetical protein